MEVSASKKNQISGATILSMRPRETGRSAEVRPTQTLFTVNVQRNGLDYIAIFRTRFARTLAHASKSFFFFVCWSIEKAISHNHLSYHAPHIAMVENVSRHHRKVKYAAASTQRKMDSNTVREGVASPETPTTAKIILIPVCPDSYNRWYILRAQNCNKGRK